MNVPPSLYNLQEYCYMIIMEMSYHTNGGHSNLCPSDGTPGYGVKPSFSAARYDYSIKGKRLISLRG